MFLNHLRLARRAAIAASATTALGSLAKNASHVDAHGAPSSHDTYSSMFRLDGKVALVTGASRGLGFAIACGLASQGAHVVMGGTNPETLQVARQSLITQTNTPPSNVSYVAFNVANEKECVDAVKRVAELAGHSPDILVNNAGINHRAPLAEFTSERYNHVLLTNLHGPFFLSRECAAGMKERGWGRIVNVGSIMGEIGRTGMHAYNSSKHALHGLTKSLAAELGEYGVTVNTLAPGYIRTDLTQRLQDDSGFSAQIAARTPVGRWGNPQEMAGPAVFLCSTAASYVNGATLVADGGMIETYHHASLGAIPSVGGR